MTKLNDAALADALRLRLARVFGEDIVPHPVQIQAARFISDPFTRGSFSFRGLNYLFSEGNDAEDDCDQFKDHGALLFAGEHTSPLMPGTVHGAFLTGLDAALQVACLLDVDNPIDHVDPTLLRDLWIPECLQNFGIPMTTSVLRLDEAEVLFDQLNSDLCVLGFWGVFDLCRSDFDDDTEL